MTDPRRCLSVSPLLASLVDDNVGVIRTVIEHRLTSEDPRFYHFSAILPERTARAHGSLPCSATACSFVRHRAENQVVSRALALYCATQSITLERQQGREMRAGAEKGRSDIADFMRSMSHTDGRSPTPILRLDRGLVDLLLGQSPERRLNVFSGLTASMAGEDAVYPALLDAIKWRVISDMWLHPEPKPQVRIETLSDLSYDLVSRLERSGLSVMLIDMSEDLPLTVVAAIAHGSTRHAPVTLCGAGASHSPEIAIIDAVEELAQSQFLWLATTRRRELAANDYIATHHGDSFPQDTISVVCSSPRRVEFDELTSTVSEFPDSVVIAELAHSLSRQKKLIVVSDLTSEDLGDLGVQAVRVNILDAELFEGVTRAVDGAGPGRRSACPELVDSSDIEEHSCPFKPWAYRSDALGIIGAVEKDDTDDSLWETFQENTRISMSDTVFGSPLGHWAERVIDKLSRFTLFPAVDLPLDPKVGPGVTSRKLSELLKVIRSGLATLISSPGEPESWKIQGRSVMISAFFHCSHIEGVAAGLYYVEPRAAYVRYLAPGGHSERIGWALGGYRQEECGELQVFFTATVSSHGLQHGDREYRDTLITLGRLCRMLEDACENCGLFAQVAAGFFDRELERCIGVESENEYVLSAMWIADPRNEPSVSDLP